MLFRQDPAGDGPTNMARDLALLESPEPTCRLYEWESVWVTLGHFQSASRDLVDPKSFPWIVRPTGGKAVLHGHDWTVGLAVPLRCLANEEWTVERLSRSVRQVYRQVISPLVNAFRQCGLNAALAEKTAFVGGERVADCFSHISPNDIVDAQTGVKVCGCALKLAPNAVLVQASIPKLPPLVSPAAVIREAEAMLVNEWRHEEFPRALEEALEGGFRSHPGDSTT